MWLLKLHFQISVLCALAIFGIFLLYWKKIAENGWAQGDGKKRGLLGRFWQFLKAIFCLLIVSVIPFVNLAAVWKTWEMTTEEMTAEKKESAGNAAADA